MQINRNTPQNSLIFLSIFFEKKGLRIRSRRAFLHVMKRTRRHLFIRGGWLARDRGELGVTGSGGGNSNFKTRNQYRHHAHGCRLPLSSNQKQVSGVYLSQANKLQTINECGERSLLLSINSLTKTSKSSDVSGVLGDASTASFLSSADCVIAHQ